MVTTLFQICLIISILIFLYAFFLYFKGQERKLNQAQKSNSYFYWDNPNNTSINLRFTYKGYLFEGEKHLGISENRFEVISIYLSVQDSINLKGITTHDLLLLEQRLQEHYPAAEIKWLAPLSRLSI